MDRFIIVVGTDFSKHADRALDHALAEASLREGSEVHVVHVEPDTRIGSALASHPMGADTTVDLVQRRTCERMDRMPAHLDRRRIQRVVAHYRHGSPAEGITQLARELDADVVIVGPQGAGDTSLFLGSVAEIVSRLAHCPVSVVRANDHSTAGNVEPPCGDCIAVRGETGGAPRLWCARHSEHPVLAHRRWWASNGIHAAETTVCESTPRGAASAARSS